MTEPINLTKLRADIEVDEGYGDSWHISPECALALIDAVEAAAAYANLPRPPLIPDYEWEDLKACYGTRLHAALALFSVSGRETT